MHDVGVHCYQGAHSSPSFLISQAFSGRPSVLFPAVLQLISDPANKIQIVIHHIFLSAVTPSNVRPAKAIMPRLKPRKRSSVWIIPSVCTLIDLLS